MSNYKNINFIERIPHMEWDKKNKVANPAGLFGATATGYVNLVASTQEEKMASQCGQSGGGFIDLKHLKEQKNIGVTSLLKNNINPTTTGQPIVQPSEDVVSKLALHLQNKAALSLAKLFAKPGQCQPQSPQALPNILPVPTFGSCEKVEPEQSENVVQKVQSSKTFTDGPSVPLFDDSFGDFDIKLKKDTCNAFTYDTLPPQSPSNKYTLGEIKYTTKAALTEMIQDLKLLKPLTTGCIITEKCDTVCNRYEEDVHFLSTEGLGKGSYGSVDLCCDTKTEMKFVRKQLPKNTLRASEIIVPLTLNHDNVTRFFGLIQRDGQEEGNPTMEILMEYAGTALNKFLDNSTLNSGQIWDLSRQGLEALAHINHYSIVHLDIKPENICITATINGGYTLKLTDFGSSKLPHEPLKFVGLTPEYMAPEMCKMFLQTQNNGLNWGLTEDDITGKVDTFAFALVMMYLYKKYHILVRVINNGSTSYQGVEMQTRRLMHMQLMTLLADPRNNLVQDLIPDECDLDMRSLLQKLTEHQHHERFSAKQGIEFIEARDKRIQQSLKQETLTRETAARPFIKGYVPTIALDSNFENMKIPVGVAENCLESDHGPVKSRTKDALRLKLLPYGKSGKKGKNGKDLDNKTTLSRSSVNESHKDIASKQMPMTPIQEFNNLKIEHEADSRSNMTQRRVTDRNGLVAQPSMDTSRPQTQAIPTFVSSGVNPTQPTYDLPNVNPFQSVEPENNIVSLGGQKVAQVRVGPNKVALLNLPQNLIQRWLQKKNEQQVQTKAVQPDFINIAEHLRPLAHPHSLHDNLSRKATQAESVQPMEEEESSGNIPNFDFL